MIQIYLNINVIIVKCLNRMQLKCIFWDCYASDTVEDRKRKGDLCFTKTTKPQNYMLKEKAE